MNRFYLGLIRNHVCESGGGAQGRRDPIDPCIKVKREEGWRACEKRKASAIHGKSIQSFLDHVMRRTLILLETNHGFTILNWGKNI